jgi:hypothetical protein
MTQLVEQGQKLDAIVLPLKNGLIRICRAQHYREVKPIFFSEELHISMLIYGGFTPLQTSFLKTAGQLQLLSTVYTGEPKNLTIGDQPGDIPIFLCFFFLFRFFLP